MLLQDFKEHITTHFPFLLRSKLLIACSGGLDSMVLASMCDALRLEIGIAHCNFGLRAEESEGDATFVTNFAHKIKAQLFVCLLYTSPSPRDS